MELLFLAGFGLEGGELTALGRSGTSTEEIKKKLKLKREPELSLVDTLNMFIAKFDLPKAICELLSGANGNTKHKSFKSLQSLVS